MALILESRQSDGPIARTRLQPGPNRIPVDVGSTYRIFDDQTGLAPGGVRVKRIDNNLVIDGLTAGEGAEPTSVELPEYLSLIHI